MHLEEINLAEVLCDPSQILPEGQARTRPGLWHCHHPIPLAHLNTACPQSGALSEADLDEALAEVAQAHRGRPSRWRLEAPYPALEQRLRDAGYLPNPVDPLVARLTALPRFHGRDADAQRVGDSTGALAWYRVFSAARERPLLGLDAPWDALVSEASPHHLFLASVAGVPVSCGALQVDRARGLGILWGGGTIPGARGQRAYPAVVGARIEAARALGLRWLFTYARPATSGPRLAALGFEVCGPRCQDWERG